MNLQKMRTLTRRSMKCDLTQEVAANSTQRTFIVIGRIGVNGSRFRSIKSKVGIESKIMKERERIQHTALE